MSILWYPGYPLSTTYCLTVMLLSSFTSYPLLHVRTILYFSYVLTIFAYLPLLRTCLFPYTPAYPCPHTRTYCHTVILLFTLHPYALPSNPLLFFFTRTYYLSLSSLLTYMSILWYPGPSLSLHTALLSYRYMLFHLAPIYTYVQSFTYFYLLLPIYC
jgi:hypothetical protein